MENFGGHIYKVRIFPLREAAFDGHPFLRPEAENGLGTEGDRPAFSH